MPLNISSSAGANRCVVRKELDASQHLRNGDRKAINRKVANGESGLDSVDCAGGDPLSRYQSTDANAWKTATGTISEESLQSNKPDPQNPHEVMEHKLNIGIGIVIMLNAVVIALETDLKPDDSEATEEDKVIWILLESFFCIAFCLEIIIHVKWGGCVWFRSPANAFDTLLVVIMVVDTWVLSFLSGDIQGMGMLAVLRLARMARLIRLLRIVRMCKVFYIMACAFIKALKSMVWLCIMMFVGLFLFALFTTNFIGRSEEFKEVDMGGWTGSQRFGTVFKSMYSLFELMTLEGWTEVGRPLTTRQPAMFLFLFLFIMIFTFGLLNMIVAMVVEATIDQTKRMDELNESEKRSSSQDQLEALLKVCMIADQDHDGVLTPTEFDTIFACEEHARTLLDYIQLPYDDARALYEVLDFNEPSGAINIADFIDGCAKIRGGEPTNFDILASHARVRAVKNSVGELRKALTTSVADVGELRKAMTISVADATQSSQASPKAESTTADLSELLERLEKQSAAQSQILDRQGQIMERLDRLTAGQEQLSAGHAQLIAGQADLSRKLDGLRLVPAEITRRTSSSMTSPLPASSRRADANADELPGLIS